MKNIQLAADHKGMKVCLQGMIAQSCISVRDTALAFMLAQLENHLTELGKRWYAGDQTVVDEFLQLYCIAEDEREAVKQAKENQISGDQSMSKHTPGPWSANGIYIHAPNGDRIAYMASRDSQALEDARFIAAAPEMLEALGRIEALYCNLRHGGPAPEDLQSLSDALEEACNTASDAIARATNGAQPCTPSPKPN